MGGVIVIIIIIIIITAASWLISRSWCFIILTSPPPPPGQCPPQRQRQHRRCSATWLWSWCNLIIIIPHSKYEPLGRLDQSQSKQSNTEMWIICCLFFALAHLPRSAKYVQSTTSCLKIIVYVWVFGGGCMNTERWLVPRCWAEVLASNGFVTSREHFSSIFEFFRLETIYFALCRLSLYFTVQRRVVEPRSREMNQSDMPPSCPLELHSNERVSASASPKCAAVQLSILQSLCLFFCPLLSGCVCCRASNEPLRSYTNKEKAPTSLGPSPWKRLLTTLTFKTLKGR